MKYYPAEAEPMTPQILVAFDESSQAHEALRHSLSTYPDAEIHVLHVIDPTGWVYGDAMGGYYSEDAYEQARESAEELMAEAEGIADEYSVEITPVTESGRPASTIVTYAEEAGIDHIVLGSHGRTGLARFLLGSVSETVARRSPVSVTIIREEVPNSRA